MKKRRSFFARPIGLVAAVFLLFSASIFGQKSFADELLDFKNQRETSLRAESGWLNLAGLFWLKEGRNTLGSAPSNALVFPKGDSCLGFFRLENGEVWLEKAKKAAIFIEKRPAAAVEKIFPNEKTVVCSVGSLRWTIIKRGEKIGLRLRDLESPKLAEFRGLDFFEADEKWRVAARLERPDSLRKITITNVLGQTSMEKSAGVLAFEIDGKTHRLEALDDGGNEFFILFKDATNGHETYGAGRFLYAKMPANGSDGPVFLDFNRAINPPCAFTAFATCPLAPRQNWLEIEVRAGEKRPSGEH